MKILHVMRAPVGGLFRHVVDLAAGQSARGHAVGIVAGIGGDARTDLTLRDLAPALALGVTRVAMTRKPGIGDISAVRAVSRRIGDVAPDIVHGHGAKGGAYARLASPAGAVRVYTPHGGSLHWQGMLTAVYRGLERLLLPRTELFLFECAFARDAFIAKIGRPQSLVHVVHNGVGAREFETIASAPDAADVVVIGELRHLKGIDVLIDALAILSRNGMPLRANVFGEGPGRDALAAQVRELGLQERIVFAGYRAARDAFAMGRLLVVPSRAESLPYIVLEAGAAAMPMLATNVGGIAEIFGSPDALLEPGNPQALAGAIRRALDDPRATRLAATALRERVRAGFSTRTMVDGVLQAYGETLNRAKR